MVFFFFLLNFDNFTFEMVTFIPAMPIARVTFPTIYPQLEILLFVGLFEKLFETVMIKLHVYIYKSYIYPRYTGVEN